ncbi:MAG TPA: hypothetical protein ENK50_09380, partial [Sedimenticola sp.]|nr:hypothetical protein [Sedimenticola sp.]
QVALLQAGRFETLAEVVTLEQGLLSLRSPRHDGNVDALLVRDATRTAAGTLETAEPFGSGPLAYLPPPPRLAAGEIDGGPPVAGQMGAADLNLVNGVFGDPLLHLHLRPTGRSLFFDLGDGSRLSARVAHRVSDLFISHAHMDHLAGFQWLMRSRLGGFPVCRVFGPPGLARHVACFIDSFLWDRIGDNGPAFEVGELHGQRLLRWRLQAGIPGTEPLAPREIEDGVLLEDPECRVRAVELDHHTPVLAYALELPPTLNVRKDLLRRRELEPGPWLNRLKQCLLDGDPAALIELPDGSSSNAATLGAELLLTLPGKRLVYATDLADTPENRERLVALARNAHTFFCEAAFSEGDRAHAVRNGHLTTRAAGEIAERARVARLVPFHFSRRYRRNPQPLYQELAAACPRVLMPASLQLFQPPSRTTGGPPVRL